MAAQSIPSARHYLRHVIEQGMRACEEIQKTYAMMDNPLLDTEELFRSRNAVKECEKGMYDVCQTLIDLHKELEKLEKEFELHLLYGPPSSFNSEQ